MGQLVKPDQVAGLAAYLISPESGVMTGSLVDYDQRVSGGVSAAVRKNGHRPVPEIRCILNAPPVRYWPLLPSGSMRNLSFLVIAERSRKGMMLQRDE
jgi:hypothetical protein